jgi:hypothetical protein
MTAGTGRAQNPADQELHARMSRLEESNERLLRQNGQLELEVGQLKAELHGGRDAPPNPHPNSVPVATGFNADLPRPPADPPLTETTPTQPVVQRPDSKAEAEAVDSNALDQKKHAAVGKLSWSKGDFKIVPFGWLEVQGVGATDSVTGRAVVNFVNPGSPVSQPEFNIFGQTSTLGVDIKGPEIFGLQAGGRILTVFVGDRPLLNQSTPLLVNGYGELVNEDWRFLFGTFFPIIAPLNPDSVAFAPGVAAGNLSVFRGQFRIERYWHLNDATQLTLQTGITQQVVNDFVPFAGLGAIGSDNGWPNVETRVALALGTQDQNTKERPVELGLGSVIGQLRAVAGDQGRVSETWGVVGDLRVAVMDWFGCKGEVYTGQALGTYGGGISQSLNLITGGPIRDTGGWGELYVKPCPKITTAVGYGIDAPCMQDLGPFARARNDYYFASLFWDVTRQLNVATEVDYRQTVYMAPNTDNDAWVYYFRMRLKF